MIKIKELKALSIAQPWAECIVSKGKNIESSNLLPNSNSVSAK